MIVVSSVSIGNQSVKEKDALIGMNRQERLF